MYVGQWPSFHGPMILSVSWRLVDGLMLYWRYWLISVTQTLTWNYICRSVIYILWSSDFALYLEDYLMDKCLNLSIESMWCKDMPHKMCVVQWPTFRGSVILSYRLFVEECCTEDSDSVQHLSLTYKCICRSVTYISWYSDSALYIQYYLMNKPHSLDIGSVWYGPLTCISWFSNFESFTCFLPMVVCWSLIWKYL